MTRYIDPNSGAAPQPGGYAGAHAAEKGYAIPLEGLLDGGVEQTAQLNEAPDDSGYDDHTVEELAAAREAAGQTTERTEEEQRLLEAQTNPRKVLEEEDEGSTSDDADESDEDDEDDEDDADEAYDPSAYDVAQVLSYVEEHPDEKDAVLAAEQQGKNRKGITSALSE